MGPKGEMLNQVQQAQADTELRQLMSKIQEGLPEIQISKA